MNGKIVQRIRALLALAEDQAGLPEGERAAAIAERLLREHALAAADVAVEPECIVDVEHRTTSARWRQSLVSVLARHCQCRTWRRVRAGTVHIVGHTEDVEVCRYLYTTCARQIDAAAKRHLATVPAYARRSEGHDFRKSAVAGLSARLRDLRATGRASDPDGTALVIARSDAVEAWLERQHPHLCAQRPSKSFFSQAGYDTGQRLELHAGMTARSPAGVLG